MSKYAAQYRLCNTTAKVLSVAPPIDRYLYIIPHNNLILKAHFLIYFFPPTTAIVCALSREW